MNKLVVVGPLPPPIHGESIAINNFVTNEKMKKFNVVLVNTNREDTKRPGKFSFKKVIADLKGIIRVGRHTILSKNDVFYISISQTKLGLIRDLILIQIASKRSKKIVAHLHGNKLGSLIDSLGSNLADMTKNTLKKVSVGIVLGESLKNNYRGLVKNVMVIPNGISSSYITKEEIGVAYEKKLNKPYIQILFLSNLIESKGFVKLINAVMKLLDRGLDLRLILAGEIYDRKIFEHSFKDVHNKGYDKVITYRGVVTGETKRSLLLDSDIMCLPTSYKIEAQPLSIIEGMSAALPIISTEVGAIPDLISDNGILLKENTQEELEIAIERLVLDHDLRIEQGKRSRMIFEEKYTLEKYVDGLLSVIEG